MTNRENENRGGKGNFVQDKGTGKKAAHENPNKSNLQQQQSGPAGQRDRQRQQDDRSRQQQGGDMSESHDKDRVGNKTHNEQR